MFTLSSFANVVVVTTLTFVLWAAFLKLVTPNELLIASTASCVLTLLSLKLSKDAMRQINTTSQSEEKSGVTCSMVKPIKI